MVENRGNGKMSRLTVLFLAVVAFTAFIVNARDTLCDLPECDCWRTRFVTRISMNCSVPKDQEFYIREMSLASIVDDITVTGAKKLVIEEHALSEQRELRRMRLMNVKDITINTYSGDHMNTVNFFIEIEHCESLTILDRAFIAVKGPISMKIKNCDTVSLGERCLSWLLSMEIENVRVLKFANRTFMLDETAGNVGEHGPGMTISLKNVIITSFPEQTFGSSAAKITLENVTVKTVEAQAFPANTYNNLTAVNCTFNLIKGESFAPKSLINNLNFYGCQVHIFSENAITSAVANMKISNSRFETVETGAINATVVSVVIVDNIFKTFSEKGFQFSSWTKLQMERNSFDELAPNAIFAPGESIHELIFVDNEIETINKNSLGFIGQAYLKDPSNVIYKNNYFGKPCYCNISSWLAKGIGADSAEPFESESFCTVDEFFARCFNVPEQNIIFKKFTDNVCNDKPSIQCETFKSKGAGAATEIKNPRFPHKKDNSEGLSDRDKKVIGIVIVTILGCIIIVMFITFIRWMRRRGYCMNLKNFLSSNSSCGAVCDRLCVCGLNNGLDNAGSISQLSVNEYSERHRLNEPRRQDVILETAIPSTYVDNLVGTENKMTQTLPEELTKELLENLKEKLEDPENYVEAREMIEHLYELIKVEECCNNNTPNLLNVQENIYELPFQNTTPRIGKNKKQMISVGTRVPSLDKLTPLSPYNRQTALAHEYFEPKDFAVHLYAEIANCDKEKKHFLGAMPDVVGEQAVPRGPYLRAVREKLKTSSITNPQAKLLSSSSPQVISTTKSNKSTSSNSSNKMLNRPLPEKPTITTEPVEGTSIRHG